MNRENFEKLLQANREAPAEAFDMNMFAGQPTACGTPACLLGNYALRVDLQDAFAAHPGESEYDMGRVVNAKTGEVVYCDEYAMLDHFDITTRQAERLFDADGCNNAGTDRAKALAYVEHFMATGETPHDCDAFDEDGWTDEEDDGE